MYEKLDDRIVDAIAAGHNTFAKISSQINAGLSYSDPAYIGLCIIDRRLQSLRRKGRVEYTGQKQTAGWKIPVRTTP